MNKKELIKKLNIVKEDYCTDYDVNNGYSYRLAEDACDAIINMLDLYYDDDYDYGNNIDDMLYVDANNYCYDYCIYYKDGYNHADNWDLDIVRETIDYINNYGNDNINICDIINITMYNMMHNILYYLFNNYDIIKEVC